MLWEVYDRLRRKEKGVEGWRVETPATTLTLLSKLVEFGKNRKISLITATNLSEKELDALEAAQRATYHLVDVLWKIYVMRELDKKIRNAGQAVEDAIEKYADFQLTRDCGPSPPKLQGQNA